MPSQLLMGAMRVALIALLPFATLSARADWTEDFQGPAVVSTTAPHPRTGANCQPQPLFFDQAWVFADDGGSSPPDLTCLNVNQSGGYLSFDADISNLNPADPVFDAFALGIVPTESFTNVRVSADVNVASPAPTGPTFAGGSAITSNDIFVLARVGSNAGGLVTAYLLALDMYDGTVSLARSDGGTNVVLVPGSSEFTIPSFNRTARYTLELDAIDSTITGRVFDDVGVRLAEITGTDGTYAAGLSGFGASINDDDVSLAALTFLTATFDNVSSIDPTFIPPAIPGDHDGDNQVTLADLSLVQAGLGDEFDRFDAAEVVQNLGVVVTPSPAASQSVPEPSALLLALVGLLGLSVRPLRSATRRA